MRKTTLFIFLLLSLNSFSQTFLSEDFGSTGPLTIPTGWTNNDIQMGGDIWTIDNTGEAVGFVAPNTLYYTDGGMSDNYALFDSDGYGNNSILENAALESPVFNCSSATNVVLSYNHFFTTGYAGAAFVEVFDGTTWQQVASYGAITEFGLVTIDVSTELAGVSNAQVRFRWTGDYSWGWAVDNVLVEVPPSFDAEVLSGSEIQDQYTQVPFDQIAPIGTSATINNVGISGVTNATVTLTVTNSALATVYTETSSSFSIAAGATQAVTFTGFTPTSADTYTSTFDVTIAETDSNLSNNSDSKSLEVTAGIYARDDATPAGSLGIGANNGGFIGQQFDIFNAQDLNSVTFSIANSGGVITGLLVRATIWDFSGGVPSTQIATTDFATVTATANDVYTVNITGGPINLAAGTYLVAVEEPDTAGGMPIDENVQVVTTNEIFTTGAGWVNWPTNPNGTWSNSEDFNFNVAYYIRPNLQSSLSTDENNISNLDLSLYPNPASDVLYIKNPNQLELQSVTIKDITGRIIQTIDLGATIQTESMINVSFLSTANYFATITSKEGSSTIKFIVE